MENLYSNMHNLYSLSKTLRFELKPVGKTKENIIKNGVIEEDIHRSESYKKVKKYCDEYHKKFIDNKLQVLQLEKLDEYLELFNKTNRDEKEDENFEKIKQDLRKQIAACFRNNKKEFEGLFGKDMITSYLEVMYQDKQNELKDIDEFKKFTTYFKGFNENRKNMYSEEEKSTAIAYRLVDENLPVFINNIKIYNKAIQNIPNLKETITKDLEEYIQVMDLNEMFGINYYNETLTEKSIELYNLIIAGKSKENNIKIKGLNEHINEFNQKNKDNIKIPKLKELYKQILSDKDKISFAFETIDSDEEILELIKMYYQEINQNNTLSNIENLLENIEKNNLKEIFVNNDLTITNLSKQVYENWSDITEAIKADYDNNYVGKKSKVSEKYIEEREKALKKIKLYSLDDLNTIMGDKNIVNYFKEHIKVCEFKSKIKEKYEKIESIEIDAEQPKKLLKDEKSIISIKDFLDTIKEVQEFVKQLIPKDNTIKKDENFYGKLLENYKDLEEIIAIYNKVRNYLTQKPYSTEKIKINFNCATLLNGWDSNKEKDNLGVIFLKDNNYYLGIMNQNKKDVFDIEAVNPNGDNFQKMEYKLLPGPNKMLPKVFFSTKGIETFKPSQEILDIYKAGVFKKGDNFSIDACHTLIDFYKEKIEEHPDWKNFEFKFKNTEDYMDIGEFYKDVERQGYKITYRNFAEEYINQLVDEGNLYLFQIYNKDFSKYSKGTPNLHTLYWKEIFDEDNLKNVVYKLNGEAELFYRKASIKSDKPTHPANQPVRNKNEDTIKKGKEISLFEYDLIKDKRYTVDKFQFHVPITLNFVNNNESYLNEKVNKYLKENSEETYVIGIDRGERHLLYYSVIDSNGKIVEQNTLNAIKNKVGGIEYNTDYHELLNKKEENRTQARKNWQTIENIKELKEGYMSQVIGKITELLDKYKAIIVLEDLNSGFKRSRIKVEKQVYQKFERSLIEKLNYLVFKKKGKNEDGGLLKAYQLTNEFKSFKKLGKQTGVLFYIPAWNTSKIDPTTGFVNLFYIKEQGLEKSKEFVSNIDDIRYNKAENYFEFDIDYEKFTNRLYDSKKCWTLCTFGDRIKTFRNSEKNNEWDNKTINLTEAFLNLFNKYNIDLDNIKQDILLKADSKFFNAIEEKDKIEGFTSLFKLMVQMRNSVTGQEKDIMISPIKNKYGKFFNTEEKIETLPTNADANGAYNIARKGLMLVEQIKKADDKDLGKIKYDITNKEWLNYAQNERNV